MPKVLPTGMDQELQAYMIKDEDHRLDTAYAMEAGPRGFPRQLIFPVSALQRRG
jgi:hypothetical protein